MRLNIVYADYKNEKLYSQFISYTLKNEMKPSNDYTLNDITTYMNINKTFLVSNTVTEYIDKNGSTSYKIAIVPQYVTKKKIDKIDTIVNTLCDRLYIDVSKNSKNVDVMTVNIDENDLILDDTFSIPPVNLTVNIYDNHGVFDIIKIHQINKTVLKNTK
jgi:hypothetical protein